MEKYKELALKLKALAESGEGGEKENAQKLLDNLMNKYGLTPEDLNSEAVDWHEINYHNHEYLTKKASRIFLYQIAASVVGIKKMKVFKYPKTNKISFLTTKALAVEIEAKYEFYWQALLNQYNIFYSAFIQKNRLWAKDGEVGDPTPEEEERVRKMFKMMQGMEDNQYQKMIEE